MSTRLPPYADIVISRAINNNTYTYLIPEELRENIRLGHLVSVSFGKSKALGYVIAFRDQTDLKTVKPILELVEAEPFFKPDMIDLARWISDYYGCFLYSALRAMVPKAIQNFNPRRFHPDQIVALAVQGEILETHLQSKDKRLIKQIDLLRLLRDTGPQPVHHFAKRDTLKIVLEKGWITVTEPIHAIKTAFTYQAPEQLTIYQEQALALIRSVQIKRVLLHGVTSSGKTEVYLQALRWTIDQGKQAIVLVPEISLTPQTVARFRSRFGDRIAVLHSNQSPRERGLEWYRIQSGEVDAVVGARSAIFAPLNRLGLIIVDEEHDPSYKQDNHPRYHAVDVAFRRAELTGAKVLLGSATPSLDRFFLANQYPPGSADGFLTYVAMPDRVTHQKMPRVTIVDMREELKKGNRKILSRILQEGIIQTIGKKEQVMLFLNRRGLRPFIVCRECGYKLTCPHCSVALVLHKDNLVRCHYCGHQQMYSRACPACQSTAYKQFGSGTQLIETELKKIFPHFRVIRMDRDTTTLPGAHEKILHSFLQGEADILLGTQMIAKGHDFENVSLVGVIAADITLNIPDFRAGEHTFQILTQVAGRTGRSHREGRVIVQTYQPEHYSIKASAHADYANFYEHETAARRELGYPPFSRLVRIVVSGTKEKTVIMTIEDIAKRITNIGEACISSSPITHFQILGPSPAPIDKIADRFRWQLIAKLMLEDSVVLDLLNPYAGSIFKALENLLKLEDIQVEIDVDPQTII